MGNLATKIGKKCKWGLLRESDSWGDGHCLVERESHGSSASVEAGTKGKRMDDQQYGKI